MKVAHPRNIHRLTQALHVPPVMRADSKLIKELLAEQLECNVTIMAVVVDIGKRYLILIIKRRRNTNAHHHLLGKVYSCFCLKILVNRFYSKFGLQALPVQV